MERNVWADMFIDIVVRRSGYDTLMKTSVVTMVLVVPFLVCLVLCVCQFSANADVFRDSDVAAYILLDVVAVAQCCIASFILLMITRRSHRHLVRDIVWMEAVSGYVGSHGADTTVLDEIRGEVSERGWTVKILVSAALWAAIGVILVAMGVSMYYRTDALDNSVMGLIVVSYIILLAQFVVTIGSTAMFPSRHDSVQCRFTEELSRRMADIGVECSPMERSVSDVRPLIHVILFVATLGLYSFVLLLLANHRMNAHLKSQWEYETVLMMRIIRNEDGIGVEGIGDNQPSNAALRFLRNAL